MAKVHVCNVMVLDNPSPFRNPFQFEITFECIEVKQEHALEYGRQEYRYQLTPIEGGG